MAITELGPIAINQPARQHMVSPSLLRGLATFSATTVGMPDVVTLDICRPTAYRELDHRDFVAVIEARIRAAEDAAATERRRSGGRVVGRRKVLAQDWSARPASREPRRELDPRVAARSKWSRIEAVLRNRAFRDAYVDAREFFIAGVRDIVFPAGTYWLRRFVQAICAPWPEPG